MPSIKNMNMEELCAYVANHLQQNDIEVVLVGGACVSFYSNNQYQTLDLDFIQQYSTNRKDLAAALAAIGFTEHHRYFKHADTNYFLEFPTGPIAVGDQPVHHFAEVDTTYGKLLLLTATDICKDRLAAFYHWGDEQSLQQAIAIAKQNDVAISEIQQWSKNEGESEKFKRFKQGLNS